jgi:hypothetical protein
VILGALGVGAERLGLLERAAEQATDLLASAREPRTPASDPTTQSVGSLRTSGSSSAPPGADLAQPSALSDDTARALPSVASRQTDEDVAPASRSSGASPDRGVPKDDTGAREDARVARAVPPRATAKDGPASKRVKPRATTDGSGSSTPTAAKREPSAKNAAKRSGSRTGTADAMPRVTAGPKSPKEASAQTSKDPRRTKPRAASQKPSRKTGQDGIIRQSPF